MTTKLSLSSREKEDKSHRLISLSLSLSCWLSPSQAAALNSDREGLHRDSGETAPTVRSESGHVHLLLLRHIRIPLCLRANALRPGAGEDRGEMQSQSGKDAHVVFTRS